ncbi:MAG TPA: alpha/beta hydrolase [Dyella sp.]|nr:alpha/beta hydrolase [Dyella sp.]
MGVVVAIAVAIFAGNRVAHHRGQEAESAAAAASSVHGAAKVVKVAPAPPATWKLGSLTLSACELGQPNSGQTTAAWCAPFEVPENRDDPASRTITLRLAVVRSNAEVAAKDMLVFLAGGPGQAATENAAAAIAALDPLLAHRNLLLLDQRGTGGSHPLSCKNEEPPATPGDELEDDPAKLKAEVARCLAQVEKHADPRFYTTTIATRDLEDVRKALGSPSFDLVGVSYGTRMAQQYAMRFPDAVRSIVLDGVVPNSLVLGEDFAQNLDDALKAQFARCTADAECHKRFGDPYQTLYQLRDALRANPHTVSFRDPQTYQTVQRRLSEFSLASVVRMFAYSPITAALLPLSIDAAAHGDVGPLLGQAKLLSGDLADTMNGGMQSSVICSEDADLFTPRPQDAQTILGTRMVDALTTVCSVWPHGTRPKDFHDPLKTNKPVLLMSGQYDPVTPPRYGEEVLKGLSNARHLVARGQGHSVMAAGCMPKLIKHFVEDLQPKTLDASCLDRLQPTPMFIDFNGATP